MELQAAVRYVTFMYYREPVKTRIRELFASRLAESEP